MFNRPSPIRSALLAALLITVTPLPALAQNADSATIKQRLREAQKEVDARVAEARARAEQAVARCKDADGAAANRQVRKGDTSNLTQTQSGDCNSQSAVIGQSK